MKNRIVRVSVHIDVVNNFHVVYIERLHGFDKVYVLWPERLYRLMKVLRNKLPYVTYSDTLNYINFTYGG